MIALKFAMAVPGLAVLVLGSIDLYSVQSDRTRLQDIADAAALAGARELGLAVDAVGPEGRALAYIEAQLTGWTHGPAVSPSVEVITLATGERALRAALHGNRPSFFGNMLPPGGWQMDAEATATSIAVTPLCVLAHGSASDKIINIKDSAQIRAPACLVHSNRDVVVEGVARLSAAAVQAVTRASGSITPSASTGAVSIDDPFSGLNLSTGTPLAGTGGCSGNQAPTIISSGRQTLRAGTHCNAIIVQGTGELVLERGEHWFVGGSFVVKENGRLFGEDVVLLFNKQGKFEFKDHARVSLSGRRTGAYAGLVMVSARDNTQDFIISSDNVENLLGVIYVPSATLIVEGSADVARESAWTVIVSRSLQLKGSPSLFINANYQGSDVPVPEGVGPSAGATRLIQ